MSNNGSITLKTENNIGTIEFHHPKGNSLPGKLLRQLAEKITQAGQDDKVKIIVLKSKGNDTFCAGASFDELMEIDNLEQGKHFFMGFTLVLNAMRTCPKLIIVCVQGKTVGGGVGIAAAGDYTFAHQSAAIKLSELALGIGPFVVGPAVKRKIGTSAFSTLAIDATNWHDAEWACNKGLFQQLVETYDELDEAVEDLASTLAESSPQAMEELKTTLWQGTDCWDSLLEKRAKVSGELVLSDHTKEFIRQFRKK